jgi:hypothetical protein
MKTVFASELEVLNNHYLTEVESEVLKRMFKERSQEILKVIFYNRIK